MFDFNTVPNITFGVGSINNLGGIAKSSNFDKPLLVTDRGIVESGLLERVQASLTEHDISACVFCDVEADPPEENILSATELARQSGCDAVIGFGGGSSMDVAKLTAVLIGGRQTLAQLYGVDQITASRVPLIQIPTTAGTGSEVTHIAVVTTGESSKAGVVSKTLFADHVLLDPELTLGMPARLTAITGIDAMVHAIEAYTSKRLKNPISDTLALRALRLMSVSIRNAVNKGDDLDARSNMLLGAMLAGQAFSNAPVGAVHALAYPLGGIFHIPHGLSNSLMLPHVLRFNGQTADPLYGQLNVIMRVAKEPADAAEQLASYFLSLANEFGLPMRLRDVGIPEAALPRLAQDGMQQQRLLINNPRLVTPDDALAIYQQAF